MQDYPPQLRAMTLHFPYAWAIAKGYKREEYRSRNTSYRGYFFLHAGNSKASDSAMKSWEISPDEIVRKAFVGLARISAVNGETGDYTYTIDDRLYFPDPVLDVSGMQSVFWLPNSDRHREAFSEAWQQACDLRPALLDYGKAR